MAFQAVVLKLDDFFSQKTEKQNFSDKRAYCWYGMGRERKWIFGENSASEAEEVTFGKR
jgi:hypothetical protein